MNAENEKTLRNLGVIGSLTQNDKINTKEDTFTIYVPTALRGVSRLLYGESRDANISRIQRCIREAKTFITGILHEIDSVKNDDDCFLKKMKMSSEVQLCNRMVSALNESKSGLSALQITYKEDAASVTKLVILENEITDYLQVTQSIAQTSPHLANIMLR